MFEILNISCISTDTALEVIQNIVSYFDTESKKEKKSKKIENSIFMQEVFQ